MLIPKLRLEHALFNWFTICEYIPEKREYLINERYYVNQEIIEFGKKLDGYKDVFKIDPTLTKEEVNRYEITLRDTVFKWKKIQIVSIQKH